MTVNNEKLKENFESMHIINKWEGNLHENNRLPRFITEYLYQDFVKKHENMDKETIISQFYKFLSLRYPEKRERENIKHKIISEKEYAIIDEYNVTTDLKHNYYWLNIPSLDIDNATIYQELLEKYDALLKGGMWGIGFLKYDDMIYIPEENGIKKGIPVVLKDFVPFQSVNTDLDLFLKKREKFTKEEWIDLLINSIGINPDIYTERQKIVFLSRLIPLVGNNMYTVEIGQRATGKSYIYRNISSYTRLIAGGTASPAMLFYNITSRRAGEITIRDCIAFDEINRIHFYNPDEVSSKLKDYMDSGNFERGLMKGKSTCSFVFMGNCKKFDGMSSIVDSLPEVIKDDTAFIDRLSGIVPGWELSKLMSPEKSLSHALALRTDYLSAILHMLRTVNYEEKFNDKVELYGDVTDISIRDWKAVTRNASAIIKIIYPDGKLNNVDWSFVATYASELRSRVTEILHAKLPEEFKNKKILWKVK